MLLLLAACERQQLRWGNMATLEKELAVQQSYPNDDLSDFGTVLGSDDSFTFGELIDEQPAAWMILTDSSTVVIAPQQQH
jgi:hypothetical protein